MSNKMYDRLKWVAQILVPALATLYFAIAQVWGLPYSNEIVGTLTAVDTFLGVMLGVSTTSYLNGIAKSEDKESSDEDHWD